MKICKQYGIKIRKIQVKFVKDRPGHDFRYALNSKKISKKLNWRAKTKIDQGLKETVKWYLKNKIFFNRISKTKYEKRLGLQI